MTSYDCGAREALMKFASFDSEDHAMFRRWSKAYKRRPDTLEKHLREGKVRAVGWRETKLSE